MKQLILMICVFGCVIAGAYGATELHFILNGVEQTSPLAAIGSGSDCAVTGGGALSQIQCGVWDWPVSGTAQVVPNCNQSNGLIKATGGGVVPIVLPDAPCRGRGTVYQFTTDGKTGLTLQVQSSKTKIEGLVPPIATPISVPAGHSAWAQFGTGNVYNVGVQ